METFHLSSYHVISDYGSLHFFSSDVVERLSYDNWKRPLSMIIRVSSFDPFLSFFFFYF